MLLIRMLFVVCTLIYRLEWDLRLVKSYKHKHEAYAYFCVYIYLNRGWGKSRFVVVSNKNRFYYCSIFY